MSEATPAKRLKRLKRFIRFQLIRVALWTVSLLPLGLAQRMGERFGRLAFRVASGERKKALASLEVAFPERTEAERMEIARGSFVHLGRAVFELVCIRKLARNLESWVDWPEADRERLRAALARGKGAIFVTGHIGSWELLGWRVAREVSLYGVGKPLTDPRLGRLVSKLRADAGVKSIWRGEVGTAKAILKALRGNAVLCMLIDQDTKVQSLFVPFFGKLAATPRAAADLALRTGAAAVVGHCVRQPDGRYRLATYEVPFTPGADKEANARALTAALTQELEKAIRTTPEQWVWMHQRWKSRPAAG